MEEKEVRPAVFASAFWLGIAGPAAAVVGISTRFVDVTLEYLEVGKTYNLRTLRNIPYTVRNRGDAPITVKVEPTIPRRTEVMDGYEAVPDPSWIQIVPDQFTLGGGQTGYAEMVISIPDNPEYNGRHFQATIWARTVNTGLFAAGTQSRLRLSVGPGPEALKEEAKEKAMMTLDFDITPPQTYVQDLEPGKTYDLNELVRRKLKITNRAETPIHLKFNSIPWIPRFHLPPGYEAAPDHSWLAFKPSEEIVKEDEIATIEPILKIPEGDEHRGKKYGFLLKADLVMGVELEVFSQFFVTIREKQ
ncbi:MAG: hypothetical protein A2902_03350 [Elusimicrobia bacterium RIFCSPLOWO2_01_FULL_64_13]|nr:MAG: hypothetical protein A2636_02075 [Elusimicrobia bacterium RIFCSPHIGHO2_01_FULL_64_10]OGR95778.1 MAG: hypothetical protein A2902_03350 [Elusimicrobia bacterium RIFCSPLOWO2_01_FULL_64_13]